MRIFLFARDAAKAAAAPLFLGQKVRLLGFFGLKRGKKWPFLRVVFTGEYMARFCK
jgi:hypothetical protein